jgi:putative membrane protein
MVLAGLIHVGFFVIESLLWRRPAVHRVFGVRSAEEAETLRFAMFNQGFYNLFLALGAFLGVAGSTVLFSDDHKILVFCALFMVGAAVVLVAGNRRLWRGALLQGGPPALAMVVAVVI